MVVRRFSKQRKGKGPPLNATKLPLLRWRRGMRFSGGPHAVDRPLRLASERAVLLHYPITRGMAGVRHTVARAQHANGSHYYGRMVDAAGVNPAFAGSARYRGTADLRSFLLPPAGADAGGGP